MSKEMRDIFNASPPRRAERRKGLDARGKIGVALSVAGLMLWAAGLATVYQAFPQITNYFDELYKRDARSYWRPEFFYIAEALWAAGVGMCLLSLFQFRKRYRRRSDKRHSGILTAMIINGVTFLGFAIYRLTLGF